MWVALAQSTWAWIEQTARREPGGSVSLGSPHECSCSFTASPSPPLLRGVRVWVQGQRGPLILTQDYKLQLTAAPGAKNNNKNNNKNPKKTKNQPEMHHPDAPIEI